jgi:molecular chaperone HscB
VTSYFEILGLPERYDIDAAELERAYHERSKSLHPDRFAAAPAAERVAALQQSMGLNEAYKALKKPQSRAEYLLRRAGVTIGGNERLDPQFLTEILELREELAEARHQGDLALVGRLEAAMKGRRDATLASLGPLFARAVASSSGSSAAERDAALADIKAALILLRYVVRYLEECEVALDEDAA